MKEKDIPNFLPLGSVVSLEGNPKTLMIIGRGMIVNENPTTKKYYDYSLCLYPEGMLGDVVLYSNHENITKVHFEGFSNEEDKKIVKAAQLAIKEMDIEKAKPKPLSLW